MSKQARWWTVILLACAVWIVPLTAQANPSSSWTPGQGEPWLFLPWDETVGRILGNEADSEGPKSFAVKPDGGVLLLDQVNLRVLDLDADGELIRYIPLPDSTFDDVEQYNGQAVLVLDRLVARTLLVMDLIGTPLAEVVLEGRGIGRSGLVTAMLPRSDGIWLEVGHRHSVKVLDRHLQPCTRQIVLGRPAERGHSLHGALDGRGGITLARTPRNDRPATPAATATATGRVTLTGQAPIRRIVWLDEDTEGAVYAVMHEAVFAPTTPFRVEQERYRMVILDEQLRELARLESPWVLTLYNQRVEIRVGPDRRLWQMAFTDDGVLLLRWDWRTP
jgi:hypothetical protein